MAFKNINILDGYSNPAVVCINGDQVTSIEDMGDGTAGIHIKEMVYIPRDKTLAEVKTAFGVTDL